MKKVESKALKFYIKWKCAPWMIIILIFCFGIPKLDAQNQDVIDSLANAIESSEGLDAVEPIKLLFREVYQIDPIRAKKLGRHMISLGERHDDALTIVDGLNGMALAHQILQEMDSLYIVCHQALPMTRQFNNPLMTASFQNMLGVYHDSQGTLDSALFYYKAVLRN